MGGYLYIPTIYVYVHMLIYIVYICMCKGLYTYYICVCYTNGVHYIRVWGYVYIGEGRVGQSARRQCTLFNFQRLPQYTNSRVVYKGLGEGAVRGQCQMHLDYNLDYYLDNNLI